MAVPTLEGTDWYEIKPCYITLDGNSFPTLSEARYYINGVNSIIYKQSVFASMSMDYCPLNNSLDDPMPDRIREEKCCYHSTSPYIREFFWHLTGYKIGRYRCLWYKNINDALENAIHDLFE